MTRATSQVLAARVPVLQATGGVPLERQLRLAAGGLVLTGTMLGLHVHPTFHLLPLLVGLALLWSGVTDCCGLGLLLARSALERPLGQRTRAAQ